MPTTDTTSRSTSIVTEDDLTPELNNVGVELEYPVAETETSAPAGTARTSGALYENYDRDDWEVPGLREDAWGYMGHDHTGAEITSGVLEIHSDEPEIWYEGSIEEAENDGHPFAASGFGETVFGLHQHVSELSQNARERIAEACSNEWALVFWCSSVSEDSLDPWRHGGIYSPSEPWSGPRHPGNRHWEFRLPEPVLPEHFSLMMDFWRKVGAEGVEAATDFARDLVYDKDERLTAIQQYHQLEDEYEDWPRNSALEEGSGTDEGVALWFADLME